MESEVSKGNEVFNSLPSACVPSSEIRARLRYKVRHSSVKDLFLALKFLSFVWMGWGGRFEVEIDPIRNPACSFPVLLQFSE